MTRRRASPPGDATRPLGDRLAADLGRRAVAAGRPRVYVPVGAAMQQALAEYLELHGGSLDDEQRGRYLRWLESLDGAVVELSLKPGRLDGLVLTIDSPVVVCMTELADLTPGNDGDSAEDEEQRHALPMPMRLDGSGTGGRSETTLGLLAERRQRRQIEPPPL